VNEWQLFCCVAKQELFDYHAGIHSKNMSSSSLSLQFSTQCLEFLKKLLATASVIAQELVYELTPLQGDSSEVFQQLVVGAIQDELLAISLSRNITSSECVHHISQVYSLLSMMNPSAEMKDLDLDGTFSDLIEASKGKTILPGLISKLWIYSCLLGRSNNYLATRFCEVEDHLWSSQRAFPMGQLAGTAELQTSLDVPTSMAETAMWKDLFHQAVFDGCHILENIIEIGLSLIHKGRLVELTELFSREEFGPLCPFLLLLGWAHCHTVDAAGSLLDAIWLQHDDDRQPLVFDACQKLAHQTQLVQWCLDKTRPLMLGSSSSCSNTTFNELFDGLEGHSVLYVLHRCTPLAALAPDDVVELLRKRPLSTGPSPALSRASPGSGPSTPSLIDDGLKSLSDNLSLKQLRRSSSAVSTAEQERDVSLYQGFYAMHCSLVAITSSLLVELGKAIDQSKLTTQCDKISYQETVLSNFKKSKEILSQVKPLTYRVELLENIFSMLFLKVSDFQKVNVDSDSDEAIPVTLSAHLQASDVHVNEAKCGNHQAVGGPDRNSYWSSEQFCVTESIAHDLLEIVKGCLFDLQAMKFAQQRFAQAQFQHQSLIGTVSEITESGEVNVSDSQFVSTSVPVQDFQQRVARLYQCVNEAKWRLQLVSIGSSSAEQSAQSLFRPRTQGSDSDISSIASNDSSNDDHSEDEQYEYRDSQVKITPTYSYQGTDSNEGAQEVPAASVHVSTEEGHQSDSGGEGDTEEKEARETISRKKRKHFHSRSPRSEIKFSRQHKVKSLVSGIIPRMLASPDTLLQLCLRNSNYDRAEEVLRMFGMDDTASNNAVVFSERLDRISSQLNSPVKHFSVSKKSMVSTQSPLLRRQVPESEFTSTAVECKASDLDELEELLSSSVTPKHFPFISKLSEHVSDLTGVLPSLIILDIACTSCNGRNLCLDLLNMAVDRAQSLKKKSSSATTRSGIVGPVMFLHSVRSLLEHIESSQTCLKQLLNQGTCPLAPDLWTSCHESLLLQQASQDSVRMEALAAETVPVTEVEKANAGHKSPLREAMETLLKAFTDSTGGGGSYLRTLFTHADNLSSLLISCEEESDELDLTRRAYNPLAVLKEGPTVTLGRLLFEQGVQPDRLEEIASELSLNLVKIIVHCCCRLIPSMSVKSEVAGLTYSKLSDAVPVVLNTGMVELKQKGDVCLSNLDIDLLTKLISFLQSATKAGGISVFDQRLIDESRTNAALKQLLSLTSLFSQFDLSVLKTPVEELCFFTNIFNLMMIHGLLVLPLQSVLHGLDSGKGSKHLKIYGSKSRAERLLYMRHIAYHINGIGVVSAFDIYFHVLRAGLPLPEIFGPGLFDIIGEVPQDVPFKQYCLRSPVPKHLLFAITLGVVSSPFPQILRPTGLDSILDHACHEFLEDTVSVDVASATVTLPGQLKWFLSDFSTSHDGSCLQLEMIEFLRNHLSSSKASQLDGILQGLSRELSPSDTASSKQLQIKYRPFNCAVGFTLPPSFVNSANLPLPRTVKSKDLPFDVNVEAENVLWNVARLPNAKCKLTESAAGYLASKAPVFWALAVLLQPEESQEITIDFELAESNDEMGCHQTSISWKSRAEALNKVPPLQRYVQLRMPSLVPQNNYIVNKTQLSDIQTLLFEDRLNCGIGSVVSSLLDQHISNGEWDHALRLIESECCLNIHGELPQPLDIVLAGLVSSVRKRSKECDSSAHDLWKYVARMGNSDLATTIVLSYLPEWGPDFCVDVLKMCKRQPLSSNLMSLVDKKLEEMCIYMKIISVTLRGRSGIESGGYNQESSSWTSLKRNPKGTLDLLLQQKSFNSARQWIKLCGLGQDALLVGYCILILCIILLVEKIWLVLRE
jgi:zinc finger FYVE domain-containing protein 26